MVISPAGCGNRRVTDIEVAVKNNGCAIQAVSRSRINTLKSNRYSSSTRMHSSHVTTPGNGKATKFPGQIANKQGMRV